MKNSPCRPRLFAHWRLLSFRCGSCRGGAGGRWTCCRRIGCALANVL